MTENQNRWRNVALAAVMIAASAVAIAVIGVILNFQRYDQIVRTRTDSRVAQCHQDNDQTAHINHILDTFAGVTKSAEGKAFVDSLLIKPRSCSPAAIAAYYGTGAK